MKATTSRFVVVRVSSPIVPPDFHPRKMATPALEFTVFAGRLRCGGFGVWQPVRRGGQVGEPTWKIRMLIPNCGKHSPRLQTIQDIVDRPPAELEKSGCLEQKIALAGFVQCFG